MAQTRTWTAQADSERVHIGSNPTCSSRSSRTRRIFVVKRSDGFTAVPGCLRLERCRTDLMIRFAAVGGTAG